MFDKWKMLKRALGAREYKKDMLEDMEMANLKQTFCDVSKRQREETNKLKLKSDEILWSFDLDRRVSLVSKIPANNILVIGVDADHIGDIATKVIDLHKDADFKIVRDLDDGIKLIKTQDFDIIYIILSLHQEDCCGPCLFVVDAKHQVELNSVDYEDYPAVKKVKDYAGDAKVIAICNADKNVCPMSYMLSHSKGKKRKNK